ncbi:unnamed protein product [Blepharisma stoltei]|uniref:Superoxide dismutase n=1 Tax=Blepharisma stoltei TaxID=1481888 RepID=A0AAU9IZU4_9CILI|nr:unnamed protein product [Blepharisma stoltei]
MSASILLLISLSFVLISSQTCDEHICSKKQKYFPSNSAYNFTHSPLPYPQDFLQPILSSDILLSHQGNLHKEIVQSLNDYIKLNPELHHKSLADLQLSAYTDKDLQNYAGGHYNHLLYWWMLTNPQCSSEKPSGVLLEQIVSQWGNWTKFQIEFMAKSTGLFGSGWIWLCVNQGKQIEIRTTKLNINPLMGIDGEKCYPFLVNDVWEHSYYLEYLWNRASYVNKFWNILDWNTIEFLYQNYASNLQAVPF